VNFVGSVLNLTFLPKEDWFAALLDVFLLC